jgi:hypothetical protein
MTKDEALKLALANYMAAFGQALEAHGIPYGQQQIDADKQAREALVLPDPVLAERESCALVAMEFRRGAGSAVCADVAAAIRQRSQS